MESKEAYYLRFNKDEIFKNLIATEGHFRFLKDRSDDKSGFLNCCVKHLADAEGHCDEAISHALIASDNEESRKFLELRDEIKKFRNWIQTRPINREQGIKEIRRLRRKFEGFNEDYDVSKCETCGDTDAIMTEARKILSQLKQDKIARHDGDAEEFLELEKDMAQKVINRLSEKYNVAPPELVIIDQCHEPENAAYTKDHIFVCRSGINLHVLLHEFYHHLQKIGGKHLKEEEAEDFAVDFFKKPEKTLYALHTHKNSRNKLTELKDVGLIYGGDAIGVGVHEILMSLDARYPTWSVAPSLLGDVAAAIIGAYGALNLAAPWDLLFPVVGGYVAMDLWRHIQLLMQPSIRVATTTVPRTTQVVSYTTQNHVAVKPTPINTGKYVVTA